MLRDWVGGLTEEQRAKLFSGIAGAGAGAIAATFVAPLDVVKTRLQVERTPLAPPSFPSPLPRQAGLAAGPAPGLPPTSTFTTAASGLWGGGAASGAQGTGGLGGRGGVLLGTWHGRRPGVRIKAKPSGVITSSLALLWKEEGIRGLYRGLSPTMLALLPNWAVYFSVYDTLKRMLHANNGVKPVDGQRPTSNGLISLLNNVMAATGAGAATVFATNPLWVVKTRMQTQRLRPDGNYYKGTFSALARIAREEGLGGLYSGVFASLLGISHVAIQFPMYEFIKEKTMASSAAQGPDGSGSARQPSQLTVAELAVASAISKVTASTLTYPHEVVRARLQQQGCKPGSARLYHGTFDCVRKILREEGIRGFYKGCITNLLRTTPAAIITFTSFELLLRRLPVVFPPTRIEEDAEQ